MNKFKAEAEKQQVETELLIFNGASQSNGLELNRLVKHLVAALTQATRESEHNWDTVVQAT